MRSLRAACYSTPPTRPRGRAGSPTPSSAATPLIRFRLLFCRWGKRSEAKEEMMNPVARLWTAAISFALVLSVPLCAALQEKASEKTAVAPTAKPGVAEMERLRFYLGEWDYTETYPKGGKNTGVYTSKLGPGGKALITNFHSQGPVGS